MQDDNQFNQPLNEPQAAQTAPRPREAFFTASRITKIALFSALAFVLYAYGKFPLPFLFPSFLEINFSDLPALLGGFMLGTWAGVIIVCIRVGLKLIFVPTSTFFVGELADLLLGVAFVVVSTLLYKKHRSKKGAALALTIGASANVALSMLLNAFVIIPLYIQLMFGGNIDPLVRICSSVLPFINADNFIWVYVYGAALPFNLLRCAIAATVTFFTYKRLKVLFDKI